MLVLAASTASALGGDVITNWNNVYLDTIRATGGAPCPISRSGPFLGISMFEAVNAIDAARNPDKHYESYQDNLPVANANSSKRAAAAAAAHRVLTLLHGSGAANPDFALQAVYDAQLASDLAGIDDSMGQKTSGVNLGVAIADSLIALRANDGYDGDDSYTPGTHAGDWRPTPDNPNNAATPHWGNVTPWGLQSGDQFRPQRFVDEFNMDMDTMMHSQAYADQINGTNGVQYGVKDFGDRNSVVRTAEQTEIAWFWANDRDGTSKPPGQLIQITEVVSEQEGLGLSSKARLFALVNMAMGDACVAAWDSKYNTPIDLWRPIDAIRESQDDGNPNTTADTQWLPLGDFTPNFPAYVSGHATFGAVHASIMADFFGTDNITFTVGSDEFGVNPGLGYDADLTRTFTSFSQAAWENAISRVFLGVHYEWDAIDANILGYDVGGYIFDNYFRLVPAPGATTLGALALLVAARRRR
jgi:hypothetical protein